MSRQTVFVGEKFLSKSGLWFTVVEYITGKKIRIRFDESGFETIVEGQQIRKRNIVDQSTAYPKVGDIFDTTYGGKIEVIAYKSCRNVTVKFLNTGSEVRTEACQLHRGTVRDRLHGQVWGVGFLGIGPHKAYHADTKPEWAYLKWSNMLERCYSEDHHKIQPTYKGCTCDESWHNYQVFTEWAKKQIGYGIRGWALDKDILKKWNKKYCPEYCCFLPQALNNLLLRADAARGDCPIGVSCRESDGKYTAACGGGGTMGRDTFIGAFNTPEAAFAAYKVAKEKRIKEVANKWRDKIDIRAYNALMSYEVLITD